MKKLLFDLLSSQPNKSSQFHGGGEYIKTVFKYLVENYNSVVYITVFYNKDSFIDDYIINIIKEYKINVIDIKSINDINDNINLEEYDMFYTGIPYYYWKVDIPANIKFIGTFHGFRALEKYTDKNEILYFDGSKIFKPLIKRIFYKRMIKKTYDCYQTSINKFDNIICVSNHTKYALANFFPQYKKNIKMLYTPAKYIDISETKDESDIKNIGKYILLIGMNRWEKNGSRAIETIETLYMKGFLNDYKVVTIGKMPKKIRKMIKHKDRYISYDYVEAVKLESLYKNCDIFFYPSLNEGFGMPPLEAMKYGKTCVISSICSLPEIYGDAVYYVNPYDINEMCSRLLNAINEKIEANIVIQHQKMILKKQERDLKKICETIIF